MLAAKAYGLGESGDTRGVLAIQWDQATKGKALDLPNLSPREKRAI